MNFRISIIAWCAIAVLAGAAAAQAVVTVKVQSDVRGVKIPDDFCGLSFEMSNVLPEKNGTHMFSAHNKPLIQLFKTIGIKNLRVGGNTADRPTLPVPGINDIDNLFAFAKAADVKVIYTLRLRQGDIALDSKIAGYIQKHFRSQLECFAIGNEPNYYLRKYPDYIKAWKQFATAIRAAVPSAKFCGPSALNANAWPGRFVHDLADTGLLSLVTEHAYFGAATRAVSAEAACDRMLSPAWDQKYQQLYNAVAVPASAARLPYRIEETSNFTGGVAGASNAFASALWALDYLHWWAAHGADGINFHNRRWINNCVVAPDPHSPSGEIRPRPIAYGLLAFSLGGQGIAEPVVVFNPDRINVTVYAVREGHRLFVTLINKEHRPTAQAAQVIIIISQAAKSGKMILLRAPGENISAQNAISLGNESIGNDARWKGNWIKVFPKADGYSIRLLPASAAVIKIPLK